MSSSSPPSPPPPVVTDDAFIDVMLPGTASASAAITVLHDFSACTTKFANLLPGGGMVFTVNTTAPTLIVSTANAVLGTSLREYVATQLYLVPKLHASNQLPQVSSSDLEIVIEHGLSAASSASSASGAGSSSGGGKNTRYFLCAVVSADAAINAGAATTASGVDGAAAAAATATPALIGNDAALTAFLQNIDTVSSASAQLKANNAKRLPLDTPLSFPGISTCMSYPDTKGNTVLLTSAPLLASPALVARLFALVSASAPVFSNFDLQQAQVSSVSLVGFRANAPALAFAPIVSVSSVDAVSGTAAPGESTTQEEAFQTPSSASAKQQQQKTSASASSNTGPLTSSQVLALVSLLVVGALVVLPAWLYGPQIYAFSVIHASGVDASTVSGTDPASVNRGILVTKGFYVLGSVLAAVLVGVGASMALYPALIAGIVIALMLCALVASVFYDAGVRSHSVVRGIPGINPARLLDVLRYDYTSSTTA